MLVPQGISYDTELRLFVWRFGLLWVSLLSLLGWRWRVRLVGGGGLLLLCVGLIGRRLRSFLICATVSAKLTDKEWIMAPSALSSMFVVGAISFYGVL